jgi:uncharacterized protein (DUF58 family)
MIEAYRTYLAEGRKAGMGFALCPPGHVPVGTAGNLLGKAAGASLEFMDHREYQPGDDLRRIDWSAYARTDRLILKLYREEINPHVDLVLDASASMALPESDKPRGALAMMGLFAAAAANSGFTHGAWQIRDGCERIPNGNITPELWDGIELDFGGDPVESFHRSPPAFKPRGMRILISDLLFLGDPMQLLSGLTRGASSVIVVQLLSRNDVDPPDRGSYRLADSETGELREVFVDAATQQRYRNTLADHQQNWSRAARQIGATLITIVAEEFCETWESSELVSKGILA